MNYRVDWAPRAEQQLAAAWIAATDRAAVTTAAARLDAYLARDPLRLGDALDSSVYRIAFIDPLGAEFEVIEDDKRVIVQGVFAVG
jgi:hypothetical protein